VLVDEAALGNGVALAELIAISPCHIFSYDLLGTVRECALFGVVIDALALAEQDFIIKILGCCYGRALIRGLEAALYWSAFICPCPPIR